MRGLIRRLGSALTTLPDGRGWAECAGIAVATLAALGLIAMTMGLADWRPRFEGWPLRLLGVMIVPALTEELAFRGLLIPARGESRYPARWFLIGIAVFVAWHILEALTFLPGAWLFLTPPFLLCAALLGIACAVMRYRTGSLWPAVLLHAALVFAWQVMLGGPTVRDLI